jgi:hypothetical protein
VRFVGRLREGAKPAIGIRVAAEFTERDGRPDLEFVLT